MKQQTDQLIIAYGFRSAEEKKSSSTYAAIGKHLPPIKKGYEDPKLFIQIKSILSKNQVLLLEQQGNEPAPEKSIQIERNPNNQSNYFEDNRYLARLLLDSLSLTQIEKSLKKLKNKDEAALIKLLIREELRAREMDPNKIKVLEDLKIIEAHLNKLIFLYNQKANDPKTSKNNKAVFQKIIGQPNNILDDEISLYRIKAEIKSLRKKINSEDNYLSLHTDLKNIKKNFKDHLNDIKKASSDIQLTTWKKVKNTLSDFLKYLISDNTHLSTAALLNYGAENAKTFSNKEIVEAAILQIPQELANTKSSDAILLQNINKALKQEREKFSSASLSKEIREVSKENEDNLYSSISNIEEEEMNASEQEIKETSFASDHKNMKQDLPAHLFMEMAIEKQIRFLAKEYPGTLPQVKQFLMIKLDGVYEQQYKQKYEQGSMSTDELHKIFANTLESWLASTTCHRELKKLKSDVPRKDPEDKLGAILKQIQDEKYEKLPNESGEGGELENENEVAQRNKPFTL